MRRKWILRGKYEDATDDKKIGENKWRGAAFWWSVLVTPENTQTVIFFK
ncbi:hypothetical protein [Bacillus massilinigeriensis]|nr:hypothetical protein [Bacillus massilionigeriensis]